MKTIAENIKNLRTIKNLSQQELADFVFTTKSTISKWESGMQTPSIDSLRLLSSVFKVPMFVILGEKPTTIRDKTWQWFGKGVFYALFWMHLDIWIGLLISVGGLLMVTVGISLPIVKPLTVLIIDLTKNGGADKYEIMKIVSYFLISPMLSSVFIGFGLAMLKFARIYWQVSTKVFWNINIKLLDKKFALPKIKKIIWIYLGLAISIGVVIFVIAIGLIAVDNSWSNRMW